jgi:hybrid polyketide synthase/nonribosomal peptide synthetase ACE1
VQIILVDLLKAANIRLSAVVGHSSGEIGAAYAAGVLSSHDAIRIAHYRGLFARLAGSQRGDCVQKGSMLAVGTSWEDAQELVQLKAFKKRLAMAAHNSPASVTLSGDADAVVHAKKVFDEEKKFARQLKVDTAYHSHHMVPCSDPYVDALRACEIRANRDREDASCTWYSSVYPGTELGAELDNTYWGDNMTNTVLFAEAVENALAADPQLSAILEVGPHPALKGPVTQILSELRSATSPAIPYSGVLNRGVNDVEAFSDALGFVWTTLGPHSLDLQSYQDTLLGGDSKASRRQQLVVGLPSYQWSHSRTHWHESRRSRRRRRETKAVHEILGVFSPDSTPHNLRWTNILKVSEIPWLEGHFLQGQVIFPAAGYVAMALEATRMYASQLGDAVELLELNNFVIAKPIVFDEDPSAGVETLVTLTAVRQHADDTVTADFSCYTCPSISMGSEQDLALTASGNMRIVLGEPDIDAIPCTFLDTSNMTNVDSERFYSSLSELGYGYAGNFRSMSSLKRRLNQSSFSVDTYPYSDLDSDPYLIHPTTLDVAIQGAMLAYSAPGDGRLWSLHVPTSIDCITVNPQICTSLPTSQCQIPVCTVLDDDTGSVRANIEIFGEDGQNGMIRMEGLAIKPITPASEAHDRRLFSYTKWYVAAPDGSSIESASQPSKIELEVAALCLRMASYYSRKWESEIIEDDWIIATPHCLYLRDYVNQLAKSAAAGENSRHQEWQNDTDEDINTLISRLGQLRTFLRRTLADIW